MLVRQALDGYLRQMEADGRSPHTVRQARRHVMLLVRELGEVDLESLSHEHVARVLSSSAVMRTARGGMRKPSSANAVRSSLRGFFGFAHAAGYASSNAARLVRRARCGPPAPRGLSGEEERRILAALDEGTGVVARRDRALYRLMLATGIRLGSALALRVEDLDLEAGELHLRQVKGGREALVPIDERVRELLRVFVGPRRKGHVFASAKRSVLCPRQAHRRLAGLARRAGIERPIHPHLLRHSFARRLYAETKDLLAVQEALGHRSIMSTAVYATAAGQRRSTPR